MSPAVCSICGDELASQYHCHTTHPDLCHDCWQRSMAGNTLEHQEHLAPAPTLVLTPRDVQALTRYRIHRQAVRGTGPCAPHVVREEEG